MVDFESYTTLKNNIAYSYTQYADHICQLIFTNNISIYDRLKFIILTRAVKHIDNQNIATNAKQLESNYGDYSIQDILKSLHKINRILRTDYRLTVLPSNIQLWRA